MTSALSFSFSPESGNQFYRDRLIVDVLVEVKDMDFAGYNAFLAYRRAYADV